MMNMATCAALSESEHSVVRIYLEVLNRWPYCLEAAYEVARLTGTLETVVTLVQNNMTVKITEGASKEQTQVISVNNWLVKHYRAWTCALDSCRGGVLHLKEVEAERTEWMAAKEEFDPKGRKLEMPSVYQDPIERQLCAQMEMYRGNYKSVVSILSSHQGSCDFGGENLVYACLRTSNMEMLREQQSNMVRGRPYRWETWYATALREWMEKRNVLGGLEHISRAQIIAPTNTLLLVTRAYMGVYRVKDGMLKLMLHEDDAGRTIHRMISEAAKSAELAIRDAWSFSRDPFVTYSLLHIYSMIASYTTDAKIMEVLAEVDALNPFLKRAKTNMQACIAQIAPSSQQQQQQQQQPLLAKIYSRLLAMKAKLCLLKPGLLQMALETANNAKAFDPSNALAQCVSIIASAYKSAASPEKIIADLQELLKKVDEDMESANVIRKELLPIVCDLVRGDFQVARDMAVALLQNNSLDEDAIFWAEYTRIRMRELEEVEEDEEASEAEV
jgi:hypothetical protein